MNDTEPKFQIGDIVVISDSPTIEGKKLLEKLRFYTITRYRKSGSEYLYEVNGLHYWFSDINFYLYSRDDDVSQNKPEIDKSQDIFCTKADNVISDKPKINYIENPQTHDCNASPEDEQIFNAMQITLDAAKYSAFPFGSPDYLMNIKFGGSYNKK